MNASGVGGTFAKGVGNRKCNRVTRNTGGISFLRGLGRARTPAFTHARDARVNAEPCAKREIAVVGKTTKAVAVVAHRRPN